MKQEKLTIYIAGAVTSDIKEHGYLHCYQKFENAEKTVAKYFPGAIIYNPMKLCKADWSWMRCMVVCLWVLLKKCDAIVLIDDYKTSKGAMIELRCAIRNHKTILRLEEFIAMMSYLKMVNESNTMSELLKIQLQKPINIILKTK